VGSKVAHTSKEKTHRSEPAAFTKYGRSWNNDIKKAATVFPSVAAFSLSV